MQFRRLARIALLVFLAGPVLNLECFVACATKSVTASTEECHRGTNQAPVIESPRGCGDVAAHVTPFVKSGEALSATVVALAADTIDTVDTSFRPAPTPVVLGVGPPDRLPVVTLRI